MRTRWILTLALLLAMLLLGASLAEGAVFTVPDPTGGDDWENIMEAFEDAQAAGAGSTVEFSAGTYLLSQPVLVENWNGTVRGAGKDLTVLRNGVTPFPRVNLPEDMYGPWSAAGLLVFRYPGGAESELHLEGMTFAPVGLSEPDEWYSMTDIQPVMAFTGHMNTYARVNGAARGLRFVGDPSIGNVLFGLGFIRAWGDFTVTDTDYENTFFSNTIIAWQGGTFRLGGNRPQDRVTFTGAGHGVFGFANVGTHFEIENVVAHDTQVLYRQHALTGGAVRISGAQITNGSLARIFSCWDGMGICTEEPSTYAFEHNRVQMMPGGWWAGVEIYEDTEPRSQFVITQNTFVGDLTAYFGPIYAAGTQGAVIANNRMSGDGTAAIGLLGADSGAVLKGNNLQQWAGDVGIWLGPDATGNTVVGGGRDTVLDEGTDNVITGAGSASGLIGEAVREATMLRKDVRSLWK